jgi:hypothetical protein
MELKAWAVIGEKKSFWLSKRRRWTVGVVDTATEAHRATTKLNKWSEDQVRRTKTGVIPLLLCPWDVQWSLQAAKQIEYSFEPLFVFPNHVKE